MGRTERETPKHQSPLRPSPGTPAGGRVRPAQLPALPHSLPPGAYTRPTRYSLGPNYFTRGGAPHLWLRGPTIHGCVKKHTTRHTQLSTVERYHLVSR